MMTRMPVEKPSSGGAHTLRSAYRAKRRKQARQSQRPLWLTEQEAETLALLSGSSLHDGGPAEQALFAKLGKYLRTF